MHVALFARYLFFFETKGAKIIIWVVNIYVARLVERRTIIPYTECV